ncbi:hypothetical protein CPB86DRAFT_33352 [Serendipita vermifera]|nr:hypothetical protein CPB86DRAFT_33352 [Serendipita vermifera]
MPSPHSHMQNLNSGQETSQSVVPTTAQKSDRGRRTMQRSLKSVTDTFESAEDSPSLKIKLTVPPNLRKKTVARPSRSSGHANNKLNSIKSTPAVVIKRRNPQKPKGPGEGDEYAPPRGFKSPKTKVIHQSHSAPSRKPQSHQVYHPSPDHKQSRFPTFVPASILSSDDLTESEETDFSDEETNEETEDDEVSPEDLMANDKRTVLERVRTHRELLGSNDGEIPTRVPWTHKTYNRSRQRTPALPTAADDGEQSMSSGSDEDDELSQSEDEDEDDVEPNVQDAARASEEEDDVLDAKLFFNNLLEGDSASDEEAHSEEDSVMGHAIVEAGESSETDTDVEMDPSDHLSMVKEGWDGQLVFSTEIHPPLGLMDFALDQQAHAMEGNPQGDSLANSMSTLPVTQPTIISDEEEFEDMESEAGDTTDDEILTSGMPALPPTTVAPDATLTPARVLATLHPFPPVFPSPSPSDILAVGKATYPWDTVSSPVQSIAATDDFPPRSRSNSTHSLGPLRGPRLGFFRGASFGSKRTIIGDADGKLPSPFSNLTPAAPVFRRKRRANSDLSSFFNKRTRNSHALHSSYFSDDFSIPMGQGVDLDELLDASLLSEDVEKHIGTISPPEPTLSRWDRIPMDIYRETRDAPTTHDTSMSFSFAIGGFRPPPLPRPNFTSPRSHVSHGSLDSILWEDEILSSTIARRTSNHNHHNHHHSHKRKMRDHDHDFEALIPLHLRAGSSRGDRTPTQLRSNTADISTEFLSEAKSRKERRKEKKREKASLQKQILSALDETLAEGYEEELTVEEV